MQTSYKRKKALGLNKTENSASFRVSIDSKSNNWRLKNIKMGDPNLKSTVDYSRSKSTFSRTKSVDELNETAESICNLEFKLSNKKNSCS